MTSPVENKWSSNGLPPEALALLQELRQNYRRDKAGERGVKTARKRLVFIAGGVIFSGFTGLLVVLHLAGLF
jgi:hypothetical protein